MALTFEDVIKTLREGLNKNLYRTHADFGEAREVVDDLARKGPPNLFEKHESGGELRLKTNPPASIIWALGDEILLRVAGRQDERLLKLRVVAGQTELLGRKEESLTGDPLRLVVQKLVERLEEMLPRPLPGK